MTAETPTQHEYTAYYAFQYANSYKLPKDERGGYAHMKITTDEEPKTQEQFDEIAKTIFQSGDYSKIRLIRVFETVGDDLTPEDSDAVEGNILD